MPRIKTEDQLLEAIERLEVRQADEGQRLKAAFLDTLESLRPANLIKRTVKDLAASEDFKNHLLTAAAGVAAGFAAKMLVEKSNGTALNKLLSAVAQYGVTSTITNHPEMIKAAGAYVTSLLSKDGS